MINTSEILQTVRMITEEKLDIRTITMGISLYECVHPDREILYRNVYDRITTQAKDLVKTGEALERECGIPIVIMDANDIDQNQLGKCDDFPLTDDQIQDAMKDNPSGQGGELTPLILIRPLA